MIDNNDGKWSENGNVTFSKTSFNGESHIVSESFLANGNAFGRNINQNNNKNLLLALLKSGSLFSAGSTT